MESKGWEPPSQLDDHMVETTLRCRVIRRRVYRIVGLQFLDFSTGARSKLGCKWCVPRSPSGIVLLFTCDCGRYTMELMTVLMDMLIFYLLPIVIIYIAIDMQYVACVRVARGGCGVTVPFVPQVHVCVHYSSDGSCDVLRCDGGVPT